MSAQTPRKISRRDALRALTFSAAATTLAACAPQVVTQIVKETQIVESTSIVKETQIVEKEVTAVPPQKDTSRVQFMGWGQPSEQQVFQTLITKYQTNNPQTIVDYILVPPGEFLQKLTTMVAADESPDVFYMADGWFGSWVSKGVLLDIGPLVDQKELDNIWPKALKRYMYDGTMVGGGKLYCLPKDLGPWVMVYNKDIFDKYSIPYPATDGSWTWDDAIPAWKEMTKILPDGMPETFGCGDWTLESAVWSNGADFLNKERNKVTIDDPLFIEALQKVADLANVEGASPNNALRASMSTWDMWNKGMLATHVMGPWDQPTFWNLPFGWDIAPFPSSPASKKPASWTGSMGFAVSARTQNPQAAVDLQRYFSVDEDGQRTNYQMGQAVPNRIDMAKGEFLAFDKPPAHRQVFLDNIETWGHQTVGTYVSNNKWMDTMWQEMAVVWNGEASAEQWCTEWAPQLTELLNSEEQIISVID